MAKIMRPLLLLAFMIDLYELFQAFMCQYFTNTFYNAEFVVVYNRIKFCPSLLKIETFDSANFSSTRAQVWNFVIVCFSKTMSWDGIGAGTGICRLITYCVRSIHEWGGSHWNIIFKHNNNKWCIVSRENHHVIYVTCIFGWNMVVKALFLIIPGFLNFCVFKTCSYELATLIVWPLGQLQENYICPPLCSLPLLADWKTHW